MNDFTCDKCGLPMTDGGIEFFCTTDGCDGPTTPNISIQKTKTYRDGLLRAAEIADEILIQDINAKLAGQAAAASEIKQAILKEANSPQQEGK